jgi:hypothetical protein
MPATPGDRFDSGRQCSVPLFELAKHGFGVRAIDIDDEDAGSGAGGEADVALGIATPPAFNDVLIRGRSQQALGNCWLLAARQAWEYPQAALS